MHASIEQLLSTNDPRQAADGNSRAQADSELRTHLEECEVCQLELRRIDGLRAQLKALPEIEPSPESADASWAAIIARKDGIAATPNGGHRAAHWWPLGLAASLLVAALTVMLAPWQGAATRVAAVDGGSLPAEPGLAESGSAESGFAELGSAEAMRTVPATAQLVARSQQLEQMLGNLQYEPRVVNARTAGTIARLEDQIAWIDYGLGEGSDGQISESDANALWQQRVELMNSLVHVRYAQAQRVDF